jgi:hypothetical protein
LIKRFPIRGERLRADFRAEAFNVFNHANFANPTLSENSAAFGRILTATVNPRIMQLALKLSF